MHPPFSNPICRSLGLIPSDITSPHNFLSFGCPLSFLVFQILLYGLPLLYLCFVLWRRADKKRDQGCYILDYQCYKPSVDQRLSTEFCGEMIKKTKNLGLLEYLFLLRAIVSSGIGKLLDRSRVSPSQIDFIVVTVSTLAAVPSLCTRIINRYKMREYIKAFNLTGMECSGSLISVDLVQHLFKSYKNKIALVVTSESLSQNWYSGNDRSMILANCLFRSGGCAMRLMNNGALKSKCMFKLKCLVIAHHGTKDESFGRCIQKEDDQGRMGFYLGKNLPEAATRAFVSNLKEISPTILPLRELV
ncbi:hypothetical protein MLD38_025232 [Melastoma candidum]|uniref:Uncharacterized protein n=1 Tax=Melastoma candidum TaxID=119954 RepID=A0ACB9NUU7_9MYRT|nr:hypothetical protein MLD38_025232 [Melastoma candidum]